MKHLTALILAIILIFSVSASASAQGAESIWLSGNSTDYKTGETIIVTVNAATVVPIQGFTFQIRYDPACLKPLTATSPIPGMNGLKLPQVEGLVDASFASTTPKAANGTLSEVHFEALGGCQTNLVLESAALAIKDARGMAAKVDGIAVSNSTITLNVDSAMGAAAPEMASDSALQLAPVSGDTNTPSGTFPRWAIVLLALPIIAGVAFGAFKWLGKGKPAETATATPAKPARSAYLQFKHGPQSGKIFTLNGHPCLIGSAPGNDICIDDPHIIEQHAKIFSSNKGYFLTDLGGETYINGQAIQKSSAALKSGDVVRLGKRALFIFGA